MDQEHDKFLDLIVKYYNVREDYLENNTRERGIMLRKVLKEIREHSKVMLDKVLELQHERRKENLRIFKEKGYVPRKGKPKTR